MEETLSIIIGWAFEQEKVFPLSFQLISHFLIKYLIIQCALTQYASLKRSIRALISLMNLKKTLEVMTDATFTCYACANAIPHFCLKAHMLTHTGNKSDPCDYCEKLYSARMSVNVHRRVIHPMNLKKINDKIGIYTSFYEVITDARWIVHNSSIVFPGKF